MATSTISFAISNVCDGGNHGTITISRGGNEIGSFHATIPQLKEAVVDNDVVAGFRSVAVEMIRIAGPTTLQQLKDLINNMTIDVGWPS